MLDFQSIFHSIFGNYVLVCGRKQETDKEVIFITVEGCKLEEGKNKEKMNFLSASPGQIEDSKERVSFVARMQLLDQIFKFHGCSVSSST